MQIGIGDWVSQLEIDLKVGLGNNTKKAQILADLNLEPSKFLVVLKNKLNEDANPLDANN